MQLPIDTVIQPKFTQHRLQRALYSLWQARCRDGQIPLWQSLPCQALGPYLSAACVIGLTASNRSVIRIASTQVNQLLGQDSRGQALDSLCAPAIQPQFEHLVSQVFTRQSPMSVTLRSRAFDRESVLTMLPLLDRQGQCRRALADGGSRPRSISLRGATEGSAIFGAGACILCGAPWPQPARD